MPNGRNHNFVIQTRQKADVLFVLSADDQNLPAAEVEFNARKVEGYARILFLAYAGAAFTIDVFQATTGRGTYVQTHTLTSVAGPGGEQIISTSIEPTGSYMKITLNSGEQAIQLKVLGRPV
jgi:hypothetical protein